MSDNNTQLDARRKSRRLRKSFSLADFVVIKKKDKKTNKISFKKLTKIREPKRGKVRRKKKTTLKKRILKARENKKLHIEHVIEEIEKLEIKEEPIKENELVVIKHSTNFREYCDHFLTQEIKQLSMIVIKDLFRFQENKFQQNPIKAKANRRYVLGFKEVKKFLVVGNQLKLIIIAPDLEKNVEVDSLVEEIKELAIQHKSFYLFALPRRKIGYLLLKKVPVSILGIFDYQGTTENVTKLVKLVEIERLNYKSAKKL